MFNTSSQPTAPNSFWFSKALIPIMGVSLVTSAALSVEAQPIIRIGKPLPTTQIIGSPIPSPVPLVPGTTIPYVFSPYYNNYRDYNTVIVPGRSVINNSTLLNPRIINPRISDSVLINPVIINSPRYPGVPYRDSRIIYSSPGLNAPFGNSSFIYSSPTVNTPYRDSRFIYTSPGIQIRLGQ